MQNFYDIAYNVLKSLFLFEQNLWKGTKTVIALLVTVFIQKEMVVSVFLVQLWHFIANLI